MTTLTSRAGTAIDLLLELFDLPRERFVPSNPEFALRLGALREEVVYLQKATTASRPFILAIAVDCVQSIESLPGVTDPYQLRRHLRSLMKDLVEIEKLADRYQLN